MLVLKLDEKMTKIPPKILLLCENIVLVIFKSDWDVAKRRMHRKARSDVELSIMVVGLQYAECWSACKAKKMRSNKLGLANKLGFQFYISPSHQPCKRVQQLYLVGPTVLAPAHVWAPLWCWPNLRSTLALTESCSGPCMINSTEVALFLFEVFGRKGKTKFRPRFNSWYFHILRPGW